MLRISPQLERSSAPQAWRKILAVETTLRSVLLTVSRLTCWVLELVLARCPPRGRYETEGPRRSSYPRNPRIWPIKIGADNDVAYWQNSGWPAAKWPFGSAITDNYAT